MIWCKYESFHVWCQMTCCLLILSKFYDFFSPPFNILVLVTYVCFVCFSFICPLSCFPACSLSCVLQSFMHLNSSLHKAIEMAGGGVVVSVSTVEMWSGSCTTLTIIHTHTLYYMCRNTIGCCVRVIYPCLCK